MILFHLPYAPPLFVPPGVHYLASYLRKHGQTVTVIDLNADFFNHYHADWEKVARFDDYYTNDSGFKKSIDDYFDKLMSFVNKYSDHLVGFSCFDSAFPFFEKLIRRFRSSFPNWTFFAGGPDVYERMSLYRNLVKEGLLDFFVLKEAEKKLLLYLQTQILPDEGIISSRNVSSHPDYYRDTHLLDLKSESVYLDSVVYDATQFPHSPLLPVYASRGCSANCTFCAHKIFWDDYRSKTPQQMLRELNLYNRRWGVRSFYFVDMLLNGRQTWLETFVDFMVRNPVRFVWSTYVRVHPRLSENFLKKMVRAGCTFLSFGIESNNQRVLDSFHKGTRVEDNSAVIAAASKAGIFLHVSFIIGFPGESFLEMIDTLQFINEHLYDLDHTEIFFFENMEHSPGYLEAKEYFDDEQSQELVRIKKDVYRRFLVPFNQAGSSVFTLQTLYHEQANLIKHDIVRALQSDGQPFVFSLPSLEQKIPELMLRIREMKGKQREFLNAAIKAIDAI